MNSSEGRIASPDMKIFKNRIFQLFNPRFLNGMEEFLRTAELTRRHMSICDEIFRGLQSIEKQICSS